MYMHTYLQVDGAEQQMCAEDNTTCVQLQVPYELADAPSPEEIHHHSGENRDEGGECGREGVEFQPAVCLRRGDGRKGGNRHARVVDGRVFFQTPSLNEDTCPVSPPLKTCKLVVRMFSALL